jgi:hypothetical protein
MRAGDEGVMRVGDRLAEGDLQVGAHLDGCWRVDITPDEAEKNPRMRRGQDREASEREALLTAR